MWILSFRRFSIHPLVLASNYFFLFRANLTRVTSPPNSNTGGSSLNFSVLFFYISFWSFTFPGFLATFTSLSSNNKNKLIYIVVTAKCGYIFSLTKMNRLQCIYNQHRNTRRINQISFRNYYPSIKETKNVHVASDALLRACLGLSGAHANDTVISLCI